MAFHDSDLFVIGNQVLGDSTYGMLARGRLQPGGTRAWSTVARTEAYAWGGKAHGFNNVVVSPDGTLLYLNCGSRTDHGEVQDNGGAHPGLREEPITTRILRVPIDAEDLVLPNNEAELLADGRIYASGVRNTYDMAFDGDGRLFGVENSGDHDDPEELNWLREGHHYGFPWTAGGNPNLTRYPGYNPGADLLLNPGFPSAATDFYYDATFPLEPWVETTPPVRNLGPDADKIRHALTGGIVDASDLGLDMTSFTSHRSPLGLVFDTANALDNDLQGDGFVLSFTPGGDTAGYSPIAPWGIPVVPVDPSEDLLHLEFAYDELADNYTVQTTRIIEGFYLPVDAELVGHTLYVLEHWGPVQRSMWRVTFPDATTVPETAVGPVRMSLWPVPASGQLFWNTGGAVPELLEVFDASGRAVAQLRPRTPAGELAVEGWQPGTYFLQATLPQGPVTERFTVLR